MGPAGLLLSTVASTKHSQGSHLMGETDSKKSVNTETGYDYPTMPDVNHFKLVNKRFSIPTFKAKMRES